MRLPVVTSVVLHIAILLVALRLPAARTTRASTSIEVEVNRRPIPVEPKPLTPPVAPAPLPELKREPRVAMRTAIQRERERPETAAKKEEEPEHKTEPVESHPQQQIEPPSSLSPRAAQKIDLNLHGLPIGSGGGEMGVPGGVVGGGTGTVGTPGAQTARKPWKPRLDAGDPITGKIAEEKKEDFPLESLGRDGYAYKGPQFSAHILSDGSVSFDDKIVRDFKGLSGTFDVADMVMKSKHEDPYRHEKKKFLAATAELRDKLAKQARAEEMQASLAQLPTHLLAIWSHRQTPAAERRNLIFQIWKDAATTEDDRSAGGAEARKIIEAFIRERLPQGSPDAYTDDELESYGHSARVRFDPYH